MAQPLAYADLCVPERHPSGTLGPKRASATKILEALANPDEAPAVLRIDEERAPHGGLIGELLQVRADPRSHPEPHVLEALWALVCQKAALSQVLEIVFQLASCAREIEGRLMVLTEAVLVFGREAELRDRVTAHTVVDVVLHHPRWCSHFLQKLRFSLLPVLPQCKQEIHRRLEVVEASLGMPGFHGFQEDQLVSSKQSLRLGLKRLQQWRHQEVQHAGKLARTLQGLVGCVGLGLAVVSFMTGFDSDEIGASMTMPRRLQQRTFTPQPSRRRAESVELDEAPTKPAIVTPHRPTQPIRPPRWA